MTQLIDSIENTTGLARKSGILGLKGRRPMCAFLVVWSAEELEGRYHGVTSVLTVKREHNTLVVV